MGKTIDIGGRIHNPEVGNVVTGANEIYDDTKGKKQDVINGEVDAALEALDANKQDNLTFDQTPTESSTNPVTSGGVYAADLALQQAIEAILVLIPSAATALNQLADKSFVNSSIATASATFRGTYNLVSDLHLSVTASHQDIATALASVVSTADNNDYCFVQIPTSDTSSDIRVTERYKFNGTAWAYEYDLNNSGFTSQQWEAINSGITALLVQKLGALPTAAELATSLAGKQNVLTFDNVPTSGSDNPVKSGGLYQLFTAIDAKFPSDASANNKLVAENRLAAYVTAIIEALDASFNLTSADGHVTFRMTQTNGVIASVQILTSDIASASALTTLTGRVSTNETDIANLQQLYNDLQQSKPVPVTSLPTSGQQQGIIYRLAGSTSYADYMWNGSTWVLMAEYNNAIDNVPTFNSTNLVYSGGILDYMVDKDIISNYIIGKKFSGVNEVDAEDWGISPYIPVSQGDTILVDYGGADFSGEGSNLLVYNSSKVVTDGNTYSTSTRTYSRTILSNTAYVRFPFTLFNANTVYIKVNGVVVWTPKSENYTKRGCISYPENYKKALDYIVDMNIYAPDNILGRFYLVFLEYLNNKFYLGFRNYVNNTMYFGVTENFEKPSSGIETLGIIFDNSEFIYANITVDWSKYIADIDDQGTTKIWGDIILDVKPLSLMDKLCGKYIIMPHAISSLSDVDLIGDNTVINVYDNGVFQSVRNVTISGITFNYVGANAITTRTQKAQSGYDAQLWEPLKTPTQYANNEVLNGSTALISIAQESGQVTIKDCVFKGYPNYVIKSNANGRHIYPNHSVIEGNMFYFCLCGVYQGEEFMRFAHNEFVGCGIGVYCKYSNVNMVDNKFLRCDCGLYFSPSNDAYGQANDCIIVHSSIAAVYAHYITPSLGFGINGGTIVQGMVYCKEAYALSVTNCFLDTHFVIEDGAKNRICFNMMKKADVTETQTDLYDVPDDTQIILNRAISASDNDSDFNVE